MIAPKAIPVVLVFAATLLGGCASSKVSVLPVAAAPSHPVKAIALAPGGGLLADAVAVELSNRGYNIIDTATTTSLLVRSNARETEIVEPKSLAVLKGNGIDAVLSVKSAAQHDNEIASASARVNSTHTGRVIAGVTWQNGRGLNAGSPGDRIMKKGLVEAAAEIAEALSKSIPL